MINRILIALGLREKPRRSRLTMYTYDNDRKGVTENKKLTRLLQVDDVWHQFYTDSMGRRVWYEWHWWGPDDGWHLHNWKIEKDDDNDN